MAKSPKRVTARAEKATRTVTAVAEQAPQQYHITTTLNKAEGFRARAHEFVKTKTDMAVQLRRGSYRAADNPRSRNQTPYGGSGDSQVDTWSRRYLRELSRDMDRNTDLFRVLNDAFASAIVGGGVKYRPTTDNPKWNKEVAKLIDRKMLKDRGGMDSRNIRSGYKIQYDLVRAWSVDGETGFIKLRDGSVQPFESEQITGGTSQLYSSDGVYMNDAGRIIKYHICPYDPLSGGLNIAGGDFYAAENVEWLANRNRFSQTRGVPGLVASLDDWERLDSFRESEIIAAEQGSQIYGALEHPENDLGTQNPYSSGNTGVNPADIINGGISQDNLKLDWQPTTAGGLLDLPRGIKYVPISPGRPNPEAVEFMMELVRQFCANVGLPYEYVYNDVRGLSWSVNRALVQMARDRIGIWQAQFFGPMFTNWYTWMLEGMIANGEVEEIEDWDKHELVWPQISWPDEGAEFEAQTAGLAAGLTTRHRVHGPHWRDIMDELFTELEYASDLADKHNQVYPEFEITPNFFLGLQENAPVSPSENDEIGGSKPGKSAKAGPNEGGDNRKKPKDRKNPT